MSNLQKGFYKHYKGGVYEVTGTRIDKSNNDAIVVEYQDEKSNKYTRKLSEFQGVVVVNGNTPVDRYKYVGDLKPTSEKLYNNGNKPKGDMLHS